MRLGNQSLLASLAMAMLILAGCHTAPRVSGTYKNDLMKMEFKTTDSVELWISGRSVWSGDYDDATYVQHGDKLTITTRKLFDNPIITYDFKIINNGDQIKLTSAAAPKLNKSQDFPDDPIFVLAKVLRDD